MSAVQISVLLAAAITLECAVAHRHSNTELSFDKIPVVKQTYPSLADVDIEPSFLAAHRRKLTSTKHPNCDPNCIPFSCTHKCSMRDTKIQGSHECGKWYKMDPTYTAEYLKDHAVVTGTEDQPCTCDGCNGVQASRYYCPTSCCPNDTPSHDASGELSDYLDIEAAKILGKIDKMRVTIVDDFADLEKCRNNKFCAEYNCLPVFCIRAC